jgi:hypothetical protein
MIGMAWCDDWRIALDSEELLDGDSGVWRKWEEAVDEVGLIAEAGETRDEARLGSITTSVQGRGVVVVVACFVDVGAGLVRVGREAVFADSLADCVDLVLSLAL